MAVIRQNRRVGHGAGVDFVNPYGIPLECAASGVRLGMFLKGSLKKVMLNEMRHTENRSVTRPIYKLFRERGFNGIAAFEPIWSGRSGNRRCR